MEQLGRVASACLCSERCLRRLRLLSRDTHTLAHHLLSPVRRARKKPIQRSAQRLVLIVFYAASRLSLQKKWLRRGTLLGQLLAMRLPQPHLQLLPPQQLFLRP